MKNQKKIYLKKEKVLLEKMILIDIAIPPKLAKDQCGEVKYLIQDQVKKV